MEKRKMNRSRKHLETLKEPPKHRGDIKQKIDQKSVSSNPDVLQVENSIEFVKCSNYSWSRMLLTTNGKHAPWNVETQVKIETKRLRPFIQQLNRSSSLSPSRSLEYRVILRFCQHPSVQNPYFDCGPPKGFFVQLDGITKYNCEKILAPFDITDIFTQACSKFDKPPPFMFFSIFPRSSNISGKLDQYFSLQLVRPTTKDDLFKKVLKNSFTRNRSLEMVQNLLRPGSLDRDDQPFICTTDYLTCSLLCPLTRKRLEIPVRGKNCKHYPCFDAETFLNQSLNTGRWLCPICRNHIDANNLQYDKFLEEILNDTKELQSTVARVYFDGSFKTDHDDDQNEKINKSDQKNGDQLDIITIEEDEDDDDDVPLPEKKRQRSEAWSPDSPEMMQNDSSSSSSNISVIDLSSRESSDESRSISPSTLFCSDSALLKKIFRCQPPPIPVPPPMIELESSSNDSDVIILDD